MTFKDENNSHTGSIAAGLGNDADNGTGGFGGGAMTSGPAFPMGFGSTKTLMYFKSVPTPKTTAISPYGKFSRRLFQGTETSLVQDGQARCQCCSS